MVSGSSVIGAVGAILTKICSGSLYVAPTTISSIAALNSFGPFNLIGGGQADGNKLLNVMNAQPKFVQMHDWNHFPSEYIISQWDKA
jgi:hypothetical protein